jgi:Trk K+ transport system NAD-binding subunit
MAETLIIVVGGDHLAVEICREMLKTAGHDVVLVWRHEEDRAARTLRRDVDALREQFGAAFTFLEADPVEPETLQRAGLLPANERDQRDLCVVPVSQDDRLNLRVALLARDIDDGVRLTLRQFNPLLGHKIQEALRYNCTVISPAAHAAATYAANAVDPSCFYALPFPTLESVVARAASLARLNRKHDEDAALFGFCERSASGFGIDGMTIPAAENHLHARVAAVNGRLPYLCEGAASHDDADLLERRLGDEDRVVAFGPIAELERTWPRAHTRPQWRTDFRQRWSDLLATLRHTEPLLRGIAVMSLIIFVAFVIFFSREMGWNIPATMYYVLATMTTVGYGDVTPCTNCAHGPLAAGEIVPLVGAMLLMIAGITIFAIFTATVTSTLNATATRRTQGLRRIHRSGHVIVCGAGNVGRLVVQYLRQLGEWVVVVEKNPDSVLVELARDRKIDLLTGDATNDETIDYCSPDRAKGLIGVTNSDTANLEAALGIRTRLRDWSGRAPHVVLRIDDPVFGDSIKRHFGITSFSTTQLTAPTIAGLARFQSTRGRFALFADSAYEQTFQLAERYQDADNTSPPAPPERPDYRVRWVPLYVWRDNGSGQGEAFPIHKFEGEVRTGDRLLFLVPLRQFTDEEI